jgi:hypothetical protein
MKKTLLIALVVLVASVALLAAAPGYEKLARLSVWNRTGETIFIQLTTGKEDGNLFYYLTVKPGFHVYTVQRKVYDVKYWSCGESMSGIVDVLTQLSLTFTDCRYLHRWTYRNKVWADSIINGVSYQTWISGTTLYYYGASQWYTLEGGILVPSTEPATKARVENAFYINKNPNVMNFGEPGMEKVHTTLKRWEWITDSVACYDNDTGVYWQNGTPYINWTWCSTDQVRFGLRSYRSPFWQGNYWDSYRFSYNTNSARSLHWLEYYSRATRQSR